MIVGFTIVATSFSTAECDAKVQRTKDPAAMLYAGLPVSVIQFGNFGFCTHSITYYLNTRVHISLLGMKIKKCSFRMGSQHIIENFL